ncbi:MAG: saccharopine dehydrogenase C-terminal domain-containing protein [Candidatus Acetothermia bacterium]
MNKQSKSVLILGAGMVAGPVVDYLLDNEVPVTVASRTLSKAENLIQAKPQGTAKQLNAKNTEALTDAIAQHDLTISLLPPKFHTKPARICLEEKKPLVTTSYVSDEMDDLNEKAEEAGVLLLNEIGLDPGIDHMSAVKTIDEVHQAEGEVKSFRSYCGALPAPEESFNPLGYKFSWHPKGVLHASTSSARFLENGEEIFVEGENLFTTYEFKHIQGLGYFEQYPNRNSLPYLEKYRIPEAESIYRGTLRNIGWCETLKKIVDLGFLSDAGRDFEGTTFKDLTRELLGSCKKPLQTEVINHLGLDDYSTVLKTLEWLGLFEENPIPLEQGSPMDALAETMEEKLLQGEGERDMVILQHEFVARYESKEELITSTFVDYGEPDGYNSIAKTVGLPAAIATKMILEGQIDLTGVHIPVTSEIYEPVLAELEDQGISFEEKVEELG